jgi:hypothetical protein
VLADDFAEEVSDVVSALKVLPNLRKVPVLEGH